MLRAILGLLVILSSAAAQTIIQQQGRLFGTGGIASTNPPSDGGQGSTVAISGDGNTIAIANPSDNDNLGAVWVFVRQNGTWSQQGTKIAPYSSPSVSATFGYSLALSGDGNILLAGAPADIATGGAVWLFVRSGGTWSSGTKLTVSDESVFNPDSGHPEPPHSAFGEVVSISSDGTKALITGVYDNSCEECLNGGPGTGGSLGAVWWFSGAGGVFSEMAKIAAPSSARFTGATVTANGLSGFIAGSLGGSLDTGEGSTPAVWQTTVGGAAGSPLLALSSSDRCIGSGAVSANGSTLLVSPCVGHPQIYSGGVAGPTLIPNGGTSNAVSMVALSGDGLTAAMGGATAPSVFWLFNNANGQWTQTLGP